MGMPSQTRLRAPAPEASLALYHLSCWLLLLLACAPPPPPSQPHATGHGPQPRIVLSSHVIVPGNAAARGPRRGLGAANGLRWFSGRRIIIIVIVIMRVFLAWCHGADHGRSTHHTPIPTPTGRHQHQRQQRAKRGRRGLLSDRGQQEQRPSTHGTAPGGPAAASQKRLPAAGRRTGGRGSARARGDGVGPGGVGAGRRQP